jgi:hypothetical protein
LATVKAVVCIPWFSILVNAMNSGAAYHLAPRSEIRRFFSTWDWPIAWRRVNANVDRKNGTIFSKKPALD